jgi:hypothetical protein
LICATEGSLTEEPEPLFLYYQGPAAFQMEDLDVSSAGPCRPACWATALDQSVEIRIKGQAPSGQRRDPAAVAPEMVLDVFQRTVERQGDGPALCFKRLKPVRPLTTGLGSV